MLYRDATADDVRAVGRNMREADRRELKAASGKGPFEMLALGLIHSEECIALLTEDGTPFAVAGVTRMPDFGGSVWMLATNDLERCKMRFLRNIRAGVDMWQKKYKLLHNYVDERNTVHINWLRWLGFTFIKRHERFGVELRPFIEFVRIDNV